MTDATRFTAPFLLFALLLGSVVRPASAQRPLNLDFERPSVADRDRPWGWTLGWSAFAGGPVTTFALDSVVRRGGRYSLRIALPDTVDQAGPQSIMLQLPSDFALGRQIRVVGWTRRDRHPSKAFISLEAWMDRKYAAADTVWIRSTAGVDDPAWTQQELGIRVPLDSEVHSVVLTFALVGSGAAWFDDFALTVDGSELSTLPERAAPPTGPELAWLARHVTPLRSLRIPTDRNADDADLELFTDIIRTARIVGLGESTHGTREFFLVKHRLLEYLVRELGFRVFAIEANQLAVERINRYVQGGTGTARDAMRVMFRVWNTEEMLDLVEWLRAYNAGHPGESVRFAGYDMQDHRTPADTLHAFLERVEPALVSRMEELVGEYRAQASYATPHVADTTRARWSRQAETLWRMVHGRRTAWLAGGSTREDTVAAEWAVQSANLLRQAARFNVALSSPERDSLMAANLDWLLRTLAPNARAVAWAHDVHVSRGGDPSRSFNGGAQMGAYLSRIYGSGYRAFTLLTYDGAYSATRSFSDHQMIEAEAFEAPSGSLEAALHNLRRPLSSVGWMVDLRAARTEPEGEWLRRPRPIRHIGYAAYDYGFELQAVLPLEFDGVVFIDRTTPSRLLH